MKTYKEMFGTPVNEGFSVHNYKTGNDAFGGAISELEKRHKELGQHLTSMKKLHKTGNANWGHAGSVAAMATDISQSHGFNDHDWHESD
jgi:hypothetical protein